MALDYQKIMLDHHYDLLHRIISEISLFGPEFLKENSPHFVFRTDRIDIGLPSQMKERYPEHIALVFQNQFYNLVSDRAAEQISVSVAFGGRYRDLVIPYSEVISFYDKLGGIQVQFPERDLSVPKAPEEEKPAVVKTEVISEEAGNVVSVAFGKKPAS